MPNVIMSGNPDLPQQATEGGGVARNTPDALHRTLQNDAAKKVTAALTALEIDRDLMTTEAWSTFSGHISEYVTSLYKLALSKKHPLDNNISRSNVEAAHGVLSGRLLLPKVIGALGGAVLGTGVSLIVGILTATVQASLLSWAGAVGATFCGVPMLIYQFKKSG